MDLQLSLTQSRILDSVMDWLKSGEKQYLTLGGYAGTGKTTLMAYFRRLLKKDYPKMKVAFCSYTGKAARMLRQKLQEGDALLPVDSVSTIHMLIYQPLRDAEGEVVGWERRKLEGFDFDLIVLDEASMVNAHIWEDLLSYGVPILAVGDHGQLPPIEGQFSLMSNPELRLEEIFRQEAGNPIIRVSELARNTGQLPFGMFGRGVKKLSRVEPETQEFLGELFRKYDEEMMVLCGYNTTRVKLNKAIRQILEFESEHPQSGDRVICLRNNHEKHIFNGMTGWLEQVELSEDKSGKFYTAEVALDGEDEAFKGELCVEQFNSLTTLKDEQRKDIELFDFGYALTVHKAQGSQARAVVVFEERFRQMDDDTWRRWLYTAVTRAREELYIIG